MSAALDLWGQPLPLDPPLPPAPATPPACPHCAGPFAAVYDFSTHCCRLRWLKVEARWYGLHACKEWMERWESRGYPDMNRTRRELRRWAEERRAQMASARIARPACAPQPPEEASR